MPFLSDLEPPLARLAPTRHQVPLAARGQAGKARPTKCWTGERPPGTPRWPAAPATSSGALACRLAFKRVNRPTRSSAFVQDARRRSRCDRSFRGQCASVSFAVRRAGGCPLPACREAAPGAVLMLGDAHRLRTGRVHGCLRTRRDTRIRGAALATSLAHGTRAHACSRGWHCHYPLTTPCLNPLHRPGAGHDPSVLSNRFRATMQRTQALRCRRDPSGSAFHTEDEPTSRDPAADQVRGPPPCPCASAPAGSPPITAS